MVSPGFPLPLPGRYSSPSPSLFPLRERSEWTPAVPEVHIHRWKYIPMTRLGTRPLCYKWGKQNQAILGRSTKPFRQYLLLLRVLQSKGTMGTAINEQKAKGFV